MAFNCFTVQVINIEVCIIINYKKDNASLREAFDANQVRLWGLYKAPSNELVNVLNEKYG